jgi:hypothetical protein
VNCTNCGEGIGPRYIAVFAEPAVSANCHASIRIVGGCASHPVPGVERASAVFGSTGCLLDWLIAAFQEREDAS